MRTLEQLVDILDFKVEVMNQMPLVSTLLAVLAMTVVAVLLAGPERGRLRSYLLVALTGATLVFIFATVLNAMILPGMKAPVNRRVPGRIEGMLTLSNVVLYALLAGICVLFGAVGAFGFVHSRRVGYWVLAWATGILALFVWCCFYLDKVAGR
jgi:hypothetical protein